MNIKIPSGASKKQVFDIVEQELKNMAFNIDSADRNRPWGGFFKIDEADTQKFIQTFFNDVPVSDVKKTEKLSPKILIVEENKRLSWQYHHRRSEIWKVINGSVLVVSSDTDVENEPVRKSLNEVIVLEKGERHRLIGDTGWGIIAEIWQHADSQNPSDEEDIVRVQDDFGR